MIFKKELADTLKIPKDLKKNLPRGFQQIGDIVILNLNKIPAKYHKDIANKTLELTKARLVCAGGKISGDLRKPKLKILSVRKCKNQSTETLHKESNCVFKLDVSKVMFSKGNVKERNRIAKQIKKSEIVLDMFSGIGYFTIPIAKNSPAKTIYAIELNPISIKYLKENIKLNKVEDKVIVIKGDCRKEAPKLGPIADRISMGYLPSAEPYLKAAFAAAKNNAIIHYHTVLEETKVKQEIEQLRAFSKQHKRNFRLINIIKVKNYASRLNHYVIEFKIT